MRNFRDWRKLIFPFGAPLIYHVSHTIRSYCRNDTKKTLRWHIYREITFIFRRSDWLLLPRQGRIPPYRDQNLIKRSRYWRKHCHWIHFLASRFCIYVQSDSLGMGPISLPWFLHNSFSTIRKGNFIYKRQEKITKNKPTTNSHACFITWSVGDKIRWSIKICL